ncbi:MAG: TetR/AcrR family transcriptional regulator, partial [Rhodothermales bacterium]
MELQTDPLTRRERERLVRRHEMLRAAQEVFAEKGYNSATLEEVATRAEYGKGTLYNYFPGGKQEILLAIVERFHDELCAIIARSFDEAQERPFRTSLEVFFGESFA